MAEITSYLLNGLAYGFLLFLMSVGLSLILGMMNVLNLAHGGVFMIGGFLGITFASALDSFWLGLLATVAVACLLGIVLERAFLRPLYSRDYREQVLLTFGLALILGELADAIWGTQIRSLNPPEVLAGSVELFGAVIPTYRLFLIAVGLAVAAGVWHVLERTRLGSVIRAGVADRDMASALGFNIPAVFAGVFVFGVALAALGGFLGAPILGVYSGLDFEILILALIVVVIGGLGSLTGVFWVSLLIGIVQTFGQAYVPSVASFVLYATMAGVLLIRPEGLFQRRYG